MGAISRRVIAEGARAAQAAGAIFDFDMIHREALFITRTTESIYWRAMLQTTRDTLREALVTWQTEGLGKRGLPDLINALQPMFDRTRAKRIAVTETTRLFAEGNKLAADQDENVGGLQWQTAEDELVCDICRPRHNLIYPKGSVPECPAHVNCHCNITPASWRYISKHPSLWQGQEILEGAYV
jgi:SPP1 gp7 family putative phage head morphogenesis protein